ncbi:MAG: helix-turn-helix transcriptional regulator [Actinobacteria bacterium]|nr:helix-turn-helix transcriptional regulator [Actinomycetota bacterium]
MTETFGKRLRRLREERSLPQHMLATHGASFSYISRLEAGTRNPSLDAVRSLAAKLGTTALYLETGQEDYCPHCGYDSASGIHS